ncbi:MAG: IS1595 family transposase [Deltaproteobacteria bacterium]|nr:IS1595 family transposase [Deltaproteobacteria bacterium]MBW1855280.1 IS1595 family transposase [Deltaproteobacteria bacterium]
MTEFIITEDFPKNKTEFDERFSNEHTCYDYLYKTRWPQGFICRRCAHTAYWKSSRDLYLCQRCEHQHSLTAGTMLHSIKTFYGRCDRKHLQHYLDEYVFRFNRRTTKHVGKRLLV